MMMMMMMMMELGSFSYLGTYLLTSYYCRYLGMYVLQSEPVPDATAQSRFTDKQTDKTRQDRSRLDQVLQVPVTVPVPVPVTCIYHSPSYAMQNSRRF